MDNCVREMTRQELVAENNKLRDEIECKCKVIDEYYREKNDYQCKMKEMQKHIECLQEESKQPSNVYDEQSHFIYENELLTTVHILSDELAKLRRQKGL